MLAMLGMSDDGAIVAINLGSGLVFGIICAMIAASRGRSAVGWFFVGFFTACIGLILVLVLPDVKVEEERRRRVQLENRRLKEQLSKERQVSDQRHQQVERRLGAHDTALGVDTSAPPELTNQPQGQIAAGAVGGQWYYARDNQRQGPVSEETIRHLRDAGTIDDDALVWCEGMNDWAPLRSVDAFRGGAS